MQHAKDLKRLASEASSKIEKKTNFDEATKLRGMIMSLGLVSRLTFNIFFVSRAMLRLKFKMGCLFPMVILSEISMGQ